MKYWHPRLTNKLVLEWADAHKKRTGDWPTQYTGRVHEFQEWKWLAVNLALMQGRYGHPGGTSLAKLLWKHRGRRNKQGLPRLTVKQVLGWADAYYKRDDQWPKSTSGRVHEEPAETWGGINTALYAGVRGFPGGSSLARLLAKKRGRFSWAGQPRLTLKKILAWADAYYDRFGRWPTHQSKTVPGEKHETWSKITLALWVGYRGMPGGSSLAQLLSERRGARNHMALPNLNIAEILDWADVHLKNTGTWPTGSSGSILGSPDETWKAVDYSLRLGLRGLQSGSSLPRLLDKHRAKQRAGLKWPRKPRRAR